MLYPISLSLLMMHIASFDEAGPQAGRVGWCHASRGSGRISIGSGQSWYMSTSTCSVGEW
ncbi:hypothetical protein F751_5243 [Auxenochlorella protothecoides]|uniref:Uncharacterized protein n=1 Tax=Auxenochlorella protothecoides TaxID=3075 RepID=A0A087SQX8_AUXPR|nr:hypothetical protein F751_5243 [Auxenochlorella protothecoides]KFM28132.1 hypothetical protein F751_5243 [Auxenochlorella protothecoides]